MFSVARGVPLLFTASILSRAEHGKYDFAIPTSMRLLLINSHSYSSLLFTENDSATMLGTILWLFYYYTFSSGDVTQVHYECSGAVCWSFNAKSRRWWYLRSLSGRGEVELFRACRQSILLSFAQPVWWCLRSYLCGLFILPTLYPASASILKFPWRRRRLSF